jgi:hypothetical protein
MAIVVGIEVQHHEAVLTTVEDVVLCITIIGRVGAKNADLWVWCFGRNKSHAPGCP